MQVGAVGCRIGLHHVLTHSYQLRLLPPMVPPLQSHPSLWFFSSALVGNKVSHPAEELEIIWKWGLLSFSVPPPPFSSPARQLRPADLLPLSIVCPVDCVLPARGVEASLCLCYPILNSACLGVLQQVTLIYLVGPLTMLTSFNKVEKRGRDESFSFLLF